MLGCRLVVVERQRIRFAHEIIARFLAAEDLVRTAISGVDLGLALGAPANKTLRTDALAIETNAPRRWAAMLHLGDSAALASAISGSYGADAAAHAAHAVRDLLARSARGTTERTARFEADDFHTSRWRTSQPLSIGDQALLRAVGVTLPQGLFTN